MPLSLKLGKKQKRYLILIVPILIGAFLVMLWTGFFRKERVVPLLKEIPAKKVITINFQLLQDPILKKLLPFEEISPFEDEKGRSNPFLPY